MTTRTSTASRHYDADLTVSPRRKKMRLQEPHNTYMYKEATCNTNCNNVLLSLCQEEAPLEVLSFVVALAGPKAIGQLSLVNRFWNRTCHSETTYQALCQVLHKMKDNTETSSSSWKECYWNHVSVPHDFSTLEHALKYCHEEFQKADKDTKHMTILLEPGREYRFHTSLMVDLMTLGETASTLTITTCDINSKNNQEEEEEEEEEEEKRIANQNSSNNNNRTTSNTQLPTKTKTETATAPAILIMDTEVPNLPMFRVRQGHLILRNVELQHFSPVPWDELVTHATPRNENAALLLTKMKYKTQESSSSSSSLLQQQQQQQQQQQRTTKILKTPLPLPLKLKLTLDQVGITSFSGRGILNYAKADTEIRNSYVSNLW